MIILSQSCFHTIIDPESCRIICLVHLILKNICKISSIKPFLIDILIKCDYKTDKSIMCHKQEKDCGFGGFGAE